MRDIADAIAAIKQFTLGFDAGTFRADAKTVAAVERKLQVISEAASVSVIRPELSAQGCLGATSVESATGFDINMTMSTWIPSGEP